MTGKQAPGQPDAPDMATVSAEIGAMSQAYEALRDLDRIAQLRAIHWLAERLDAEHYGPCIDEWPF
jgi:hypothetical protein